MGLLGPRTACALLVLAAATGARGSNEYFPENVAVRKFPPALPPSRPKPLSPRWQPPPRRGARETPRRSGNAPR